MGHPKPEIIDPQKVFLKSQVSKLLLALTLSLALAYFIVLTFWLPRGNTVLFILLIIGEVFHLWQAAGYVYTIWDTEKVFPKSNTFKPGVDVFITVAGEPINIVEKTVRAALSMSYPNFKVYLLNDGYVAKKSNWQEVEALAQDLEISCITRTVPGGAKAGNINYALGKSENPFVAIFDADQVPHKDFLSKTVGYFQNIKVGFVQSPQYYKNHNLNGVTGGAWEQQELFFGAICKGKNRLNSTFLCGTNMVIRKIALAQAGGMYEKSIAEDFLTSLFIHKKGWQSVYVPEVLAEGLAPEDFLSYYNQQFRWARGSLEVIFNHNPIFAKGLTLSQKIQYLASASYYLSGVVVLIDALLPIIFLYTGLVPLNISTMVLATIFLPYIFTTLITLKLSSNNRYTFRALAFSMGSFNIHIQAMLSALFGIKTSFRVTSKKQLEGNFLHLVIPQILYIALAIIGIGVAVLREGLSAGLLSNVSWVAFNTAAFTPFILAAAPAFKTESLKDGPYRANKSLVPLPRPKVKAAITTNVSLWK